MTTTTIAFTADGSYALQLSTVLSSLARYYDEQVAILYSDFDMRSMKSVDRAARGLHIDWHLVDQQDIRHLPPSSISPVTWYRLLLPERLVNSDRILYIDTDTLIRSQVSDLVEVDMQGKSLAAARNLRAPWLASDDGLRAWSYLDLDPTLSYFNAGVLLMDAVQWRSESIADGVLSLARRLSRENLLPMADQDALNGYFAGRWTELDYRWNQHPIAFDQSGMHHVLMSRESIDLLRSDPRIVHFIGRRKPWIEPCAHPFATEWVREAQRVEPSFAPQRRGRRERAFDRLRRASRVLMGR